jgi:hypothetical protein
MEKIMHPLSSQYTKSIFVRDLKAHRVMRRRDSNILLGNRLTVVTEVVNLTRQKHFTPSKIPGTYFC